MRKFWCFIILSFVIFAGTPSGWGAEEHACEPVLERVMEPLCQTVREMEGWMKEEKEVFLAGIREQLREAHRNRVREETLAGLCREIGEMLEQTRDRVVEKHLRLRIYKAAKEEAGKQGFLEKSRQQGGEGNSGKSGPKGK